jgi:hypothetical protein
MTKKKLKQVKYLKNEIKMLKEQIENMEYNIVTDSVRGSSPYFPYIEQRFKIEGIDYKDYDRRLKRLKKQLKRRIEELMDLVEEINGFIEGIDDSLIRQAILLKYVNGLSWEEVAACVGGGNTAEGLRKRVQRFLKEK